MNLWGNAWGLVALPLAVSVANAGDASVTAEPEPIEYVRICDAYGAGYLYIPGTEICLRVSGYVRFDASAGDGGRTGDGREVTDENGDVNQTWKTNARLSLRTHTAQETELGSLKTYTETRFNFVNGETGSQTMHYAWIQLGGLRLGLDATAFDQLLGDAGKVIQDTMIHYGIKETNTIRYLWKGEAFEGVISLEQGKGDSTIDSYVPHMIAGAKYNGDWGSIGAVGAYNSVWEEWSGKVRLDVNPTKALTLFLMAGYGSDDHVDEHQYKPWSGNLALWGGGTYKLNKKTAFNTQVSYTDTKDFAVAANVAFTVVPGFVITTEIDYFDNLDNKVDESFGGIIRFQRSF
ncbi:porin [Brucella endophytica]|uniref:Porin n=1 Tax=Brucella endophytica TaxID=1963359 RepID=A0A916SK60_9HYPH|nr:porin [Brucella endophytica]GGB04143.1 porin [Brucella endophytica]